MISSLVVWLLALPLRFWYVIDLYPELGIGEPIWVIDPFGFWMISIPTGLVFLIGLLTVFRNILQKE